MVEGQGLGAKGVGQSHEAPGVAQALLRCGGEACSSEGDAFLVARSSFHYGNMPKMLECKKTAKNSATSEEIKSKMVLFFNLNI